LAHGQGLFFQVTGAGIVAQPAKVIGQAVESQSDLQRRQPADAGISEQAQTRVGLHDADNQRLAPRNVELERALERIRSQPLVRLASAVRRRLRRREPGAGSGP
jgi:hypothetical protein